MLSNDVSVRISDDGDFEVGVFGHCLLRKIFPLLFDLLSVLLLVLDIRYDGKSLWISAIECFVKCLVVDLLQDRFESVKRLLKDLVPMGVCDLGNDRN